MAGWEKRKGCTGATELAEKELAMFMLYREGGISYFALRMDAEQMHKRRMYLRRVLAEFPKWENLSNDELNDIRLYDVRTGYILEDSGGREFFLQPARAVQEDTAFRRVRAMIPFEFMDLTGKDFCWDRYRADIAEAKDMINKYTVRYPVFRDKGIGLYIYSGTKGSGKTMLACCLLNEITKRYAGSVKFVNILDFLEMTKKGFDGKDEDVAAIYKAGLLVLDDIGVQMSKEWIDTVLYRLVNGRYINRLPTIYTSNVPAEGLKIDDRITDRIDSTTLPVKLPEESIRKAARQQEKNRLLEEIENAP